MASNVDEVQPQDETLLDGLGPSSFLDNADADDDNYEKEQTKRQRVAEQIVSVALALDDALPTSWGPARTASRSEIPDVDHGVSSTLRIEEPGAVSSSSSTSHPLLDDPSSSPQQEIDTSLIIDPLHHHHTAHEPLPDLPDASGHDFYQESTTNMLPPIDDSDPLLSPLDPDPPPPEPSSVSPTTTTLDIPSPQLPVQPVSKSAAAQPATKPDDTMNTRDPKGSEDLSNIDPSFPIGSIFPDNASEYKKLGLSSHLVPPNFQANLEKPAPTTKTAAPSMRSLKRPRDRAIGKAIHEVYPHRSSCIETQLRLYYQQGDPNGAAFPWLHHPDFCATPGRIRREAETLLPFLHAAACGSTHNAANLLYHLLQRPELHLVKELLVDKLTPASQDTDSCIASGVIQFLDYHQHQGTIAEQQQYLSLQKRPHNPDAPTHPPSHRTAQAVESVVQAACWDVAKTSSVPQSRLANRLGFSQSGPVKKARRKAQELMDNRAFFEPALPKLRKECIKQQAHSAVDAFWHSDQASYQDPSSQLTYHIRHPLTNQVDPTPHPQRIALGSNEYLYELFLQSEYYHDFQECTGAGLLLGNSVNSNAPAPPPSIGFHVFRQYRCDCIGRPSPQQQETCTDYQVVSRILDNALPDTIHPSSHPKISSS